MSVSNPTESSARATDQREGASTSDGQDAVQRNGHSQPSAATDTVPVTFFANAEGATSAVIVGEFNGWSTDATPMTRVGDLFEVTVPLEPGRAHRYKFLIDGERWENDPHADDYAANEFGGHDSVKQL